MSDPTQDLVESALAGDRAAIDELLAHFLPRLHAYIRLQMGPHLRRREASIDVVQSVCREVLEEAEGFDYRGRGAFMSWLLAVALNKLRQRARHLGQQRRDPKLESPLDDAPPQAYASIITPSQEAAGREELARVERALDALPEDDRTVIGLSRVVGLSHAEIAVHLGRSEKASRSLLGRALVRLSVELKK